MAEERHILVVDDEDVITWAISQGLTRRGELTVDTASSGEEALSILEQRAYDLVITDIRMRGMNGFELLTHIRSRYPDTGVVVMTAYGSAEAKREASERGSLFYLDKTFEMDEMRQVVRSALEQVDRGRASRDQQSGGFSGVIANLSLVDMVQLHCLARNIALMEVTTPNQQGVIGFRDGEIVFAATDADLEGREAFLDMLTWSGGEFETLNQNPTEQNIDESWESLLLEASDIIERQSEPAEEPSQIEEPIPVERKPAGPRNLHEVLESLGVEQGVMTAVIAGDSGMLIDHVTTTYEGNPEAVGEVAKSLAAIGSIRSTLEPTAEQNRTIVQFERHRIVALEIGHTRVYLIVVASTGNLPHLLQCMTDSATQLTRFI